MKRGISHTTTIKSIAARWIAAPTPGAATGSVRKRNLLRASFVLRGGFASRGSWRCPLINTCPPKCPVRGDKRDTHRSGSDREDPARPKLLLAGVAPDEHPEQRVFRCPVPHTRRSGMPGPPASAVPSEQTRQLEGSATHSCVARATCNWASGTRALLRVERGHGASRLTLLSCRGLRPYADW